MSGKEYHDEETLRDLYWGEGMTQGEIADKFSVSQPAIHKWLKRNGIQTRDKVEAGNLAHSKQEPPVSSKKLKKLYFEDQLSTIEIGEEMSVSDGTIRRWMDYYDIERRPSPSEKPLSPRTSKHGYEVWSTRSNGNGYTIHVHRLLAVAEYGFEAVTDKVVHHKNRIRWDNRSGNIELLTNSEHTKLHNQISSRN